MLLEVTWGQISIHHSGLRIDFEWFQASWRLLQLTVSYNLSQAEGILKVFGLPQIGEAAKENSFFFSLPQYLLSLEETAVFACSNCFLNLSTLPGHTGSPSISSLNTVLHKKSYACNHFHHFGRPKEELVQEGVQILLKNSTGSSIIIQRMSSSRD